MSLAETKFNEFRGICIAEGELKGKWVYGNLIRSKDLPFPKWYIHPLVQRVNVEKHLGRLVVMHEVDPETVGQHIGRTDDNGNKLYDKQRVKFTNISLGRFTKDEVWAEGVIAYNKDSASFYIKQSEDYGWNLHHSSVQVLEEEQIK
jgi:hypothetical protein